MPDPTAQKFRQEREQERLQALARFQVLDSQPEPALDDLVTLAASLFQVPIALITLVDERRQWFMARKGVVAAQTPRVGGFCTTVVESNGVLVVTDTLADPSFAQHPLVTGSPWLRFYAGAPLLTDDGLALGSVCVIDTAPRAFDEAQQHLLRVLSQQVMAQLELRRLRFGALPAAAALPAPSEGASPDMRASSPGKAQPLPARVLPLSDTRLELVLRGANDGWFDWDLLTNRRFLSARGWTLLGYDEASLPDISVWDQVWTPSERERINGLVLSTIKSDSHQFSVEMTMLHRLGHEIVVQCRGYVQRDAQGRATRLSGTNTDITARRQAERELATSQQTYRLLFENNLDGVMHTRPDGTVLAANRAACAILGMTEDEICQRGRGGLIDTTDPRLVPLLQERERHGFARGHLRMFRNRGETFEAELSSVVYRDSAGRQFASTVLRDVSTQQAWLRELQNTQALLTTLGRYVPGVIYQFKLTPDGKTCFPFASAGIQEIYEVTPEQVLEDATPVFNRLHPQDLPAVSAAIDASGKTLTRWYQEYRVVLPQQGLRWRLGNAVPERLPDGSVLWHGFITDITERKADEASMHRLAYYDALTGLPNRRLLLDRLQHALASAQRSGQWGALLFIDLDNFKQINDARGHSTGDRLLQQAAQRLSGTLRKQDTAARLGGDEFVVLVGDLGTDQERAARTSLAFAEKVRELLDEPFNLEEKTEALYRASASIGLSLFPKDSQAVDDLLREADTAMYRAKANGRNRVSFFQAEMQAEVEQRLAMEQELAAAVQAQQFELYAQTQVDAQGLECGAELLLRWTHPRLGAISPTQFIPIAEASHQIVPLGAWVIEQACGVLLELQRSGKQRTLSVNVSPHQFRYDGFVQSVRDIVQRTGAPAHALIFEVTEGLLIENWEVTAARMNELVGMGIRFSIDDFGTGYSSLAYLKRLPLYELKIDRSFVQDTPTDANDKAIVESILSVARHLQLRVVAEGVETEEQAKFLRDSHCDSLQGYLFARPRPVQEWLAGV